MNSNNSNIFGEIDQQNSLSMLYGYRRRPDGRVEEVPSEQEVLRIIGDNTRLGNTMADILHILNVSGYTNRRGGDWTLEWLKITWYKCKNPSPDLIDWGHHPRRYGTSGHSHGHWILDEKEQEIARAIQSILDTGEKNSTIIADYLNNAGFISRSRGPFTYKSVTKIRRDMTGGYEQILTPVYMQQDIIGYVPGPDGERGQTDVVGQSFMALIEDKIVRGESTEDIADQLNKEGHLPPIGDSWTAEVVQEYTPDAMSVANREEAQKREVAEHAAADETDIETVPAPSPAPNSQEILQEWERTKIEEMYDKIAAEIMKRMPELLKEVLDSLR